MMKYDDVINTHIHQSEPRPFCIFLTVFVKLVCKRKVCCQVWVSSWILQQVCSFTAERSQTPPPPPTPPPHPHPPPPSPLRFYIHFNSPLKENISPSLNMGGAPPPSVIRACNDVLFASTCLLPPTLSFKCFVHFGFIYSTLPINRGASRTPAGHNTLRCTHSVPSRNSSADWLEMAWPGVTFWGWPLRAPANERWCPVFNILQWASRQNQNVALPPPASKGKRRRRCRSPWQWLRSCVIVHCDGRAARWHWCRTSASVWETERPFRLSERKHSREKWQEASRAFWFRLQRHRNNSLEQSGPPSGAPEPGDTHLHIISSSVVNLGLFVAAKMLTDTSRRWLSSPTFVWAEAEL